MHRKLAKRGYKFTRERIPLSDLRALLSDLWESLELVAILERDRDG
jgi:hypothetical protein